MDPSRRQSTTRPSVLGLERSWSLQSLRSIFRSSWRRSGLFSLQRSLLSFSQSHLGEGRTSCLWTLRAGPSSSPRPFVEFTSPISARLALELSNRPVLHSPFPSVQPSNDQHAGRCHGYSGYEVNDVVLTQIDGWEEYSYHYRNAHKGICSLQFDCEVAEEHDISGVKARESRKFVGFNQASNPS